MIQNSPWFGLPNGYPVKRIRNPLYVSFLFSIKQLIETHWIGCNLWSYDPVFVTVDSNDIVYFKINISQLDITHKYLIVSVQQELFVSPIIDKKYDVKLCMFEWCCMKKTGYIQYIYEE
jgi:hypothetical protein